MFPVETSRNEFKIGSKTIDDSAAVALADRKLIEAKSYVLVQAGSDNSGDVFVGDSSGVDSDTGWRLDAGESVKIPIDDPAKVWVIGSDADQVVKWLAA